MIPILLVVIICILCPPIAVGLAIIAGLCVAYAAFIAAGGVAVALCLCIGNAAEASWKWLISFVKYTWGVATK